ncbi:methyl-accepting chemotaxis protein [Chroococcus sp. FPU101]|uniref:methyl-accepting chemotaxis protein n=1 Tax=Chroococcus sp. FPU101 TaxID=1974212 RepID=UPI001A8E8D00|nr:HAMP domain-containing methyl-accepting chemotaxis protein [Chroococcus sp. FPU101]GFE69191.1 methyl-accepting chemotaxis sensory transducer [Chroococcus sp. FPU101]
MLDTSTNSQLSNQTDSNLTYRGSMYSQTKPVNDNSVDLANECINKILAAGNLEKSGDLTGAIALYQEVIELDTSGNYSAVAQKTIEALTKQLETIESVFTLAPSETLDSKVIDSEVAKKPLIQRWLQRFYDLPIRTKQLATLLPLELLSVLGTVGVGSYLIVNNGQAQLLQQAKSELAVLEINYKVKMNQMFFGFGGMATNPAVINAASNSLPNSSVTSTLRFELWNRKIEIATLVDKKKRIVASSSLPRFGTLYDPHELVTKALSSGEQIISTETISYNELAKDSPRLAQLRAQELGIDPATKPNFVIRYVVTPVRALNSQIVGALISGDIVKSPIATNTVNAFESGYSAVYLAQPNQTFKLVTSVVKANSAQMDTNNLTISNNPILKEAITAKDGQIVTGRAKLNNKPYTLAAKAVRDNHGVPVAVLVRGTSEEGLNALIFNSLALQGLVLALALALGLALIYLLARTIVNPIEKLQKVTEAFASGDRQKRAEAFSQDEIGQLTNTFNTLADNIVISESSLAEQAKQQEFEANKQRQEKESLQKEVVRLLLEIEEAQRGNLTVRGKVTEGVVGSIADAFNTTISKLRDLVLQVQVVSNQMNELSQNGSTSVRHLSEAASTQSGEINQALQTVAEINTSIQTVAESATEAAKIARQASSEATEGDLAMDKTVNSIETIRTTVASTAKKVKHLAESSQEISQIVEIISGISEKTNLLAFNASVEAARAGENGQGFRVVAEEVRRLADRVTEQTKEIQNLIYNIQQETATVLQAMEQSTSAVVTGTEFALQTKQILQGIAATSQQIDTYLQEISSSTTMQTEASQQVNQTMEDVSAIAITTSLEAQDVVNSLQTLVEQAKALQSSIAQFQLQS